MVHVPVATVTGDVCSNSIVIADSGTKVDVLVTLIGQALDGSKVEVVDRFASAAVLVGKEVVEWVVVVPAGVLVADIPVAAVAPPVSSGGGVDADQTSVAAAAGTVGLEVSVVEEST